MGDSLGGLSLVNGYHRTAAGRHSPDDDHLPTGEEALNEPLRAFPAWILRVVCERCGDDTMFTEINSARNNMLIRDMLALMRHDGCGGRAGKAELITGIEGVNNRPVRKIVLRVG